MYYVLDKIDNLNNVEEVKKWNVYSNDFSLIGKKSIDTKLSIQFPEKIVCLIKDNGLTFEVKFENLNPEDKRIKIFFTGDEQKTLDYTFKFFDKTFLIPDEENFLDNELKILEYKNELLKIKYISKNTEPITAKITVIDKAGNRKESATLSFASLQPYKKVNIPFEYYNNDLQSILKEDNKKKQIKIPYALTSYNYSQSSSGLGVFIDFFNDIYLVSDKYCSTCKVDYMKWFERTEEEKRFLVEMAKRQIQSDRRFYKETSEEKIKIYILEQAYYILLSNLEYDKDIVFEGVLKKYYQKAPTGTNIKLDHIYSNIKNMDF